MGGHEGGSLNEFVTKDSGERLQFDSGMVRDTTEGKTNWALVASGPMLRRWAELMTRGAEKYDEDNWMKATGEAELRRFKQSAFRHFMQWFLGETDEDHAAAVFFNINGAEYVKVRQVVEAVTSDEELYDAVFADASDVHEHVGVVTAPELADARPTPSLVQQFGSGLSCAWRLTSICCGDPSDCNGCG